MINRDKYAEYLDSALIHKFLNGLDPKLTKKIFSLKFHPPFLASGKKFFDSSYRKQGVFIVRDRIKNELIRFGFSNKDTRAMMYAYFYYRIKKIDIYRYDCAILHTHNGEQKQMAELFNQVNRFELDYHNYFLLKNEIENPEKIIDVEKLEKNFPYTGRSTNRGKEWTLPVRMEYGFYIIWKRNEEGIEKVDYVGIGKEVVKRLYAHFIDKSIYTESKNGKEYNYHHVYYPPEEVEKGLIRIAAVPVYKKVNSNYSISFGSEDVEENDFEIEKRLKDIEKRLIVEYKPPNNTRGKEDLIQTGEVNSEQSSKNETPEVINPDNMEDPPF